MTKLYVFFKSVKLAVVLILIIGVVSIIATLIPQGQDDAVYAQMYPVWLNSIINSTQMNNAFRSLIFNLAVIMFFINLSVCTIDRLAKEIKGKRSKRFGPDMIHIGLLLLIVGSIITFRTRVEDSTYMGVGQEVTIKGGYTVVLEDYEYISYDDGRPKDWISTVNIFRDGELILDSFPIEVNNPAQFGPFKLFQASYSQEFIPVFIRLDGTEIAPQHGTEFKAGDEIYTFLSVEQDIDGTPLVFFNEGTPGEAQKIINVPPGGSLGDYTIQVQRRDLTGLSLVSDPGFVPVVFALILCGIGLVLTYAQKIGDKEI